MPYSLMIVDDEKEILNGISHYFPWEETGFHVSRIAENGEQALAILREEPIDAIMTDISMPHMDGLELIRRIREQNRSVKIVILSIHQKFDYAQIAMEYGVYGYLVKPTNFQNLTVMFSRLRADLDRERLAAHLEYSVPAADSTGYFQKRIEAIKTYIDDHLDTVTLEEAAASIGANPFYLSSFFKQQTGERFSDYVLQVKMEKAAEMLADPRIRISEIANKVGYYNASNFARTFRQYSGMSPREYRFTALSKRD